MTLVQPSGNGYTSMEYITCWTYSVGTKKNSRPFLPNRYTPLMTKVKVYILGPTRVNKMCGLITYMKHVFVAYDTDIDPQDDPFHPFTHEEWFYSNNVKELLNSELTRSSWASSFWAHIFIQTDRILSRSNRVHGI